MPPSCSIVIPRPPADLTHLTTLALSSTAAEVIEILLVGDAADTARDGGNGRVHIVEGPAQPGFAARANVGAGVARGKYVLFLGSGVQPRADVVDALVRRAELLERGAVFGGKVLGAGDTIQQAGVVVDHEGCPRRLYAGFPGGHPAAERTRRMQLVSGGCMLVRREVFLAEGGFDAAFAAEEAAHDFCLRVGERGHEVHYVHDAVAVATCGGAPELGPDEPGLVGSRRLFRTRWVHRIRPDDVACYQQDGLLRLQYDDGLPVRAVVAPPFEVAGPQRDAVGGSEAERMLAVRAQQVKALLEENARLANRVAVLEARGGAAGNAEAPGSSSISISDEIVPPADLELSVGGQFRQVGDEFFTYFVEIGRLRSTDRVLDVGCGVGRMAMPLTRYLTDPGSYDGFDITPRAIAWCQTHISTRFPHFRFACVPLRNDSYNPHATERAAAFQFPYPPASFDFVLLTSVFTHLLPDAAQQYLSQIAAVLKPGGRCFSTFFLLNPESNGLIQAGLSPQFPFAHRRDDGCRVLDPKAPEAAIAYDEAQIRAWFDAVGLTIADPIRYGFWCGRAKGLSLQDIVVAVKA